MITRKQLSFVLIAICIVIASCKKPSKGGDPIINPIDSGVAIKVNTSDVIAIGVSNKIGINVNTMRDNDINLPGARPLTEALKELGVKHLRFPGGGKTNRYFWAKAPYTDPSTNYFLPGWYADASTGSNYTLLNFDQFMTICNKTGAIPQINVAVGLPDEAGSVSLNKDLAAAWVKYSNITKGYGVKFWEIGNENWNLNLSDDQLATLYFDYCTAMKKVDPTIKIMASCKNSGISAIIQKCGSLIDILDVGSYPCYEWGSYDYFPAHPGNDLIGSSDIQVRTQGGRKVVMYEFNAVDWSGSFGSQKTWLNTNDLGHGMVIFEMIGQLLTNSNIAYGNFWTTRWTDEKGNYNTYYALDKNNQILPVAKPLVVWGKFIKDTLVNVSNTGTIMTYAAFDPNSGNLNVFLSNKATSLQIVSIDITSTNNYKTGEEWQLKGTGPADTNPSWGKISAVTITNNKLINLKLPATSITVVSISK